MCGKTARAETVVTEELRSRRNRLGGRTVALATTRAQRRRRQQKAGRQRGGAGLPAEVGFGHCRTGKMLGLVWRWLCLGLCSLLLGQAEAPSPVDPPERSRPYAVLHGQNLGERRLGRACAASCTWSARVHGGAYFAPHSGISGVAWLVPGAGWHLATTVNECRTSRPWSCHEEVTCFPSAVLLGTIFSILLVAVILMAFCVYKPIRRR
ncbi:hypothetical protein J0S82_003953 [Galemys pyrenaicus]|uniref:Uncharacterized protein n=1 Tax=Galemys pyrenaicus TaxID=202257 RepID=A0A8J6A9W9_GALPY|nr:hypothetical protein J0S82_003953 [Galemys pyrenaicus]